MAGGTQLTTLGAVGGGDLQAAADIIAAAARQIAGEFSSQIPARIRVEVSGRTATITADAPPAYPNETGSRHPVFAHGLDRREWTWVPGNHRPFLGPAADQKAGEAMARYSKKIDRMCRKAGFH